MPRSPRRRRIELFVFCGFILANLSAPVVIGEVYPFTLAPMFSDRPQQYCLYELWRADGQSLDPAQFGLHLNYDGNPADKGGGIVPPPTLHEFGEVPGRATIDAHVRQQLRRLTDLPGVWIERTRLQPGSSSVQRTVERWWISAVESP